jgi:hypothetical protein
MSEMMTKGRTIYPEDYLGSLPGRIVLAVLTVVVAAGALPLVFYFFPVYSLTGVSVILVSVISLTSGLSSRIFLKGRNRVFITLTSLVSFSVGMLILGILTSNLVDFSPFPDETMQDGTSIHPWLGIFQFSFGVILTFLSVLAWSGPSIRVKKKQLEHGKVRRRKVRTKCPASSIRTGLISRPRGIISELWKKLSPAVIQKRLVASFISVKDKVIKIATKIPQLIWKPRQIKLNHYSPPPFSWQRRLGRHIGRTSIKLIGDEVHNCQYCLEPVSKNSGRGYKICPTCKTWHHADCWEAVGECQVPHHH